MATNRIGSSATQTGLHDARSMPQGVPSGVRGRVAANADQPSSDSFIAAQLARLRNLIAADQIDHNARRGTYLNIVL